MGGIFQNVESIDNITHEFLIFSCIGVKGQARPPPKMIVVSWWPPPPRWVKVNRHYSWGLRVLIIVERFSRMIGMQYQLFS